MRGLETFKKHKVLTALTAGVALTLTAGTLTPEGKAFTSSATIGDCKAAGSVGDPTTGVSHYPRYIQAQENPKILARHGLHFNGLPGVDAIIYCAKEKSPSTQFTFGIRKK